MTKLGLLTSFGPLEQPNDVAVDQSNNDVFVADVGTEAVHVFARKSASEYEQIGELTGVETPGHEAFAFSAGEPAPVAVNSASGDVYIADIDHHVVNKFAPKGPGEYQYECQITGFHAGCHPNLSGEEGTPEPHFGETAGLAIDSQGDLYVSDYAHNVVDEFKSNGEDVGQIESALTKEPANLAIDATDDLYVSQFEGAVQKLKIDPLTGTIEHEQASFGPQIGSRDVAVDPSTNDVYVSYVSEVAHYEPLGAELAPISLAGMDSEGVAVNGSTHEIYVSDKGHEDVEVYGPITVPDVKTGPSTGATETSTILTGEVNPLGTSAASYYFEYGETTAYGATTPAPPGASAGSGGVFTAVTPQPAEGLIPGTTYHYRLDATNSSGLIEEGEDRTFTTLPEEPRVEEETVSNITTESAIFDGTVKPGNGATTYHFIYGTTAAYGNVLPNVGIGAGFAPVAVEQSSGPALEPNTLYHFALVAHNASGTATGPDQTFRTLPAPAHPETPPALETGQAVAVGPNGAILTGIVFTENTPTTFLFELGTSTAYGTRLYGGEPGPPEEGPTSVSIAAGNLQPGTEYHYRLIAVNAAGTTVGPDRTFTTSTFPELIAQPSTPGLVPIPVFPAVKNPVYRPPKKKHHKAPPKKPKHRRAHRSRAARRRPRR